MPQVSDQTVQNASGAAVRVDINGLMGALFSSSSGAAAPTPTVAGMLWFDTTNGILNVRNAANTLWVAVLNASSNLSDLANIATARTNLGGTAAGIAIWMAATAAAQRTALGLAIGTDVQAFDADLAAIAAIADAQGDLIQRGAANWERLAIGTAGQLLTVNSGATAAEWATPGYAEVSGSPFTLSGASPYTVTGLGSHRDILVVGRDVAASVAGIRQMRVGNSTGVLATNLYGLTVGGLLTESPLSDSTASSRGFMYEVLNFNTKDGVKPVRMTGSNAITTFTWALSNNTAFDRIQLLNSVAATFTGTIRIFGRN